MSSILTAHDPKRFAGIFPIQHQDIWDMYEKQRSAFWWDTDVTFGAQDLEDWNSLSDDDRYFMSHILAFFASADGIVMENLIDNFISQIKLPEARFFFTIQNMIESTHALVYAKLLDGYIADPVEKERLKNANLSVSFVKAKTDWAIKWMQSGASLAELFVAFACVEGVFFQGEFCAIFWMKERRKLPALTTGNYLISRDERLHVEGNCLLYRNYIPPSEKLSDARAHQIIREALEIEKNFINKTLDCSRIGMNKELMSRYIDHVANQICGMLGHVPLFEHTSNPFEFMNRLCFDVKENFFETRVTSYKLPTSDVRDDIDNINFDFA